MHKLKVIGASAELIKPDGFSQKFKDLHELIGHINRNKIKVENPEILPSYFKKLID